MGPQITKTQPSFLPFLTLKETLPLCCVEREIQSCLGPSSPKPSVNIPNSTMIPDTQASQTRGAPGSRPPPALCSAESWAGGPGTGKPVGNCPYSSELPSPGVLSHLLLMLLATPLETDCPKGSGLDVLCFRGKRITSWEKCCLGEGTKDALPSTEDPAVEDPWSPCLHCWLSLPLPEVLSPEGNPESLIRKGMMNPAYNWKDAKGKVTEVGPYLSPLALWGL